MKFLKFMVHDFLKINVPRFFEIHSPRFFGIQCPKDFCDFGLLKVPKREIFDRSNFPDFYRIRSSRVGDLVVKILT